MLRKINSAECVATYYTPPTHSLDVLSFRRKIVDDDGEDDGHGRPLDYPYCCDGAVAVAVSAEAAPADAAAAALTLASRSLSLNYNPYVTPI